ncbi:MAG: hypothetical protein GY853_10515 [PVC group bacterium]|nr:hypothetical protein [PVC group bacterium]
MEKKVFQTLGKIILSIILVFVFSIPIIAQEAISQEQGTYVGAETCKACHPQRYEDFFKRKFKKAWKVLEMRGETENPECLKCHTTGYGEPGGFKDAESTPNLRFKQCESCHGPASLHVNDMGNKEYQQQLINYVKDQDVCIKCHVCVSTHSNNDF